MMMIRRSDYFRFPSLASHAASCRFNSSTSCRSRSNSFASPEYHARIFATVVPYGSVSARMNRESA